MIHEPTRSGVPPYTIRAFAERRTKYCVAVFALNEGSRLTTQIEAMRPLSGMADILVADGGSTDGALDALDVEPRVVRSVLVNQGSPGLGVQMRMAFDYALGEEYEGVIVVDGNGKDDTSAIPAFVRALDDGVDHVQGSRFVPGGRHVRTPIDRLVAVRLIHAPLISLAAWRIYTDTTNGFRAYSRRFLQDPRVDVFRDLFVGYELHYYLAIRAARLGYRIREIPVTRSYPPTGVPTKIHGMRGRARVVRALVDACLGNFNPAPRP